MEKVENILLDKKHLLILESVTTDFFSEKNKSEYDYIKNNFCGNIIENDLDNLENLLSVDNQLVYVCGDIGKIHEKIIDLNIEKEIKVSLIGDWSYNYDCFIGSSKFSIKTIINIGQVPCSVHGVGVLLKNVFSEGKDYFSDISREHEFQGLTESNKGTSAFRSGIYISHVDKLEEDEYKFKLLRCSSNFTGGTDNLRETDHEILMNLNNFSSYFFQHPVELNHILAQIYHNNTEINEDTSTTQTIKQKRAKIKKHSDKTKDMPSEAVMAFCSFYENFVNGDFLNKREMKINRKEGDMFGYYYKDTSCLTVLRFKLKNDIDDEFIKENNLDKQFDVKLYPNSVFFMSLRTNRLYTHEIVPPPLQIENIPTRMGYVVRCSNTEAIYKNNKTFILKDGEEIELTESFEEEIDKLKGTYYEENITSNIVNYEEFNFSLNKGDYTKPIF